MATSALFAIKHAAEAARAEIQQDNFFPLSQFLCPQICPLSVCLSVCCVLCLASEAEFSALFMSFSVCPVLYALCCVVCFVLCLCIVLCFVCSVLCLFVYSVLCLYILSCICVDCMFFLCSVLRLCECWSSFYLSDLLVCPVLCFYWCQSCVCLSDQFVILSCVCYNVNLVSISDKMICSVLSL